MSWLCLSIGVLAAQGGGFIGPPPPPLSHLVAKPPAPEPSATPSFDVVVADHQSFLNSFAGATGYPTAVLIPGETLTVVGERPDGWLEVLPPVGEFSLLPADAVRLDDEGVGTVHSAGVPIAVGSRLNPEARYVYQSTTRLGMRLQPLDEVILEIDGRGEKWYRVVPPEGERRFVRTDDVRLPDGRPLPGAEASPAPAVPQPPPPTPYEPVDIPAPVPPPGTATPIPVAKRPAGRAGVPRIPPAVPIGGGGRVSRSLHAATAAAKLRDDVGRPADQRLADFAKQLRRLKARDPATWPVAQARLIADDVHAAVGRSAPAGSPLRAEADRVLAETRQLESLHERYLRSRRQAELVRRRDAELDLKVDRLVERTAPPRPAFDAHGLLERASVRLGGVEAYKLVGADGVATHFVRPAPGLDLAGHVGHRVGVYGSIDFSQGLTVPVVLAQQVAPIAGGGR